MKQFSTDLRKISSHFSLSEQKSAAPNCRNFLATESGGRILCSLAQTCPASPSLKLLVHTAFFYYYFHNTYDLPKSSDKHFWCLSCKSNRYPNQILMLDFLQSHQVMKITEEHVMRAFGCKKVLRLINPYLPCQM